MWLPTPIYERLPHVLLLVGLVFMSTVMYMGPYHPQTPIYFGAGFFCCLWSMVIFTLRLRHREPAQRGESAAQESDTESEHGPKPAA